MKNPSKSKGRTKQYCSHLTLPFYSFGCCLSLSHIPWTNAEIMSCFECVCVCVCSQLGIDRDTQYVRVFPQGITISFHLAESIAEPRMQKMLSHEYIEVQQQQQEMYSLGFLQFFRIKKLEMSEAKRKRKRTQNCRYYIDVRICMEEKLPLLLRIHKILFPLS